MDSSFSCQWVRPQARKYWCRKSFKFQTCKNHVLVESHSSSCEETLFFHSTSGYLAACWSRSSTFYKYPLTMVGISQEDHRRQSTLALSRHRRAWISFQPYARAQARMGRSVPGTCCLSLSRELDYLLKTHLILLTWTSGQEHLDNNPCIEYVGMEI